VTSRWPLAFDGEAAVPFVRVAVADDVEAEAEVPPSASHGDGSAGVGDGAGLRDGVEDLSLGGQFVALAEDLAAVHEDGQLALPAVNHLHLDAGLFPECGR